MIPVLAVILFSEIVAAAGESKLAVVGSAVAFECSSDSNYTITWWHAAVGSETPVKFFSKDSKFYRTGFRINATVPGYSFFTIDNVTIRHAGKYYCRAIDEVDVVDLAVITPIKECFYSGDLNSTKITCNVSMSGNLNPELTCTDEFGNASSPGVSGYYRDSPGDRYSSTTVRLSRVSNETTFSCSIFVSGQSPPFVGISVRVVHSIAINRKVTPLETTGVKPGYVVIALVIIVAIVSGAVVYFRRRNRNAKFSKLPLTF